MEFKICRLVKRCLFVLARYPVFQAEYIDRSINKPTTSREDLQSYNESSNRRGRFRTILLVLVYVVYSIKNSIVPIRTLLLFDHYNLESNIELVGGKTSPEQWLRSSCLVTNCTRLSKNRSLAEDLSKLPIFHLCTPYLDKIYSPITKLDALGLLLYATSTFSLLLLGSWVPVQQLLYPTSNETIMFITAPEATTRTMRVKARELLVELFVSNDNFCLNSTEKRNNFSTKRRLIDRASVRNRSNGYNPVTKTQNGPKRVTLDSDKPLGIPVDSWVCRVSGKTNEQFERIADDCLPTIRSNWWRHLTAQAFCQVLALTLATYATATVFVIALIQKKIYEKQDLLNEFANEIRQQNCLILANFKRYNNDDLHGFIMGDEIQLSQLDLSWTGLALFQTGVLNLLPLFTVAIMFTYYFILICELICWINEIRLYLIASLVVAQYFDSKHNDKPIDSLQGHVKFSKLKCKHINETEFKWFMFIRKATYPNSKLFSFSLHNSQTNDALRIHQFWSELQSGKCLGDNDNCVNWTIGQNSSQMSQYTETDIENLEKVYINFRLFVEHIRGCTPGLMRILIIICYLLDYGSTLIAVGLSRRVRDFKKEPMVVVTVTLIVSNFFIIMAANFHANVSSLI